MEKNHEGCRCPQCHKACEHVPGWFLPGEAERAAILLGMDLPTFFKEKLVVDWWAADERIPNTVFLLAPGRQWEQTGTEAPDDPRGQCIFFTDTKECAIHANKPHECRVSFACRPEENQGLHLETARAWENEDAQAQIRALLGREPQEGIGFGILDALFGSNP